MAVQADRQMDGQMDDHQSEITDLCAVLWREREILDLVLFKLTAERLVVAAAETRWLAHANRELESALGQLHSVEVLRAVQSGAFAVSLGLPADATLASVAQLAVEPWSTILMEHRDALLERAAEIADAVERNRRLLDAGSKSVRETLMSITAAAGTYDSRGVANAVRTRLSRLDEQA